MNKKLKKLLSFFWVLILIALFGAIFYHINNLNYIKIKEIKLKTVNHPEFLPTSNFAKITAFGFKNTKADVYWLETIQYIWSNAISSVYKKYLYKMIDLITDLNPYFVHPYKIGMLLLPDYNARYENLTDKQQDNYIKQAEKIWLKWIKNFCDENKIKLIEKEDNLQKIWTEDKYKNPCKNYEIPYYLAFIYYFYEHNPEKASLYYKIASANEDSIAWAKMLAAIMKWKGWDREKAFLMFLNMWKSLDNTEDKTCSWFASLLQDKVAYSIFRQNKLDYNLLKFVNNSREKLFWKYKDSKDLDNQCSDYINKAVRELNLYFVEQANKKYRKDTWENASDAKELFDKWYLQFLPIDYQQYDDYGIIYKYNKDTGNFDYEMGKYED